MKPGPFSSPEGPLPASGAAADPSSYLSSLYVRWRQPLLRLFRGRMGHHREGAEDAMHEVFVRLAVSGKTLTEAEEAPYLSTAARSVAVDGWRRQSRTPDTVSLEADDADLGPGLDAESGSPLEAAAHRERIARLNDAVSELPECQRQAFLLNRIDGLSHEEVAAAMGISARMVAKHLHRAMAYCQLRVKYASLAQMERLLTAEEAPSPKSGSASEGEAS